MRTRTATRQDILDRYRAAPATPSRGAQGGASDSGARPAIRDASNDAARIAAARRDLAARQASAGGDAVRGSATRGTGDTAQVRPLGRPDAALASGDRDALAGRVASARKDYLASIEAKGGRGGGSVVTGQPGRGQVGGVVAAVGGRPAVTAGPPSGGSGHGHHHHYQSGHSYNGYCHNGWSVHYGHSFWGHWGGYYGWGCSSWFWSPFYACGYWWNSYWYCGGYWHHGYRPHWYWYGPFLPCSVSVIVYEEPEVVVVEREPEVIVVDAPAGEAVVPAAAPAPAPAPAPDGTLNRAADYYLSLGDRAFREARFGDAVHYYAKAIEFSPDDGILHLVLADALFATGDYRYAAYALREALGKDPALATNVVDKRSFYADPAQFDQQLAVLERYLEDHFLDDDARLVLAANYLFGGRPIDALKLLESPFSETLRGTPAGSLLLDAARNQKSAAR